MLPYHRGMSGHDPELHALKAQAKLLVQEVGKLVVDLRETKEQPDAREAAKATAARV
jgi:hypothetical protein